MSSERESDRVEPDSLVNRTTEEMQLRANRETRADERCAGEAGDGGSPDGLGLGFTVLLNVAGACYSLFLLVYVVAAWIGGGEAWFLHLVCLPLGFFCLLGQCLLLAPLTLSMLWVSKHSSHRLRWTMVAALVVGMSANALIFYAAG